MPRLNLRPITRAQACAFITEHHRHHRPPVGALWYHAATGDDGAIVAVAVVGRPVARALDDGLTVEVTRLCSDGTVNACSMLYAAARRAGTAKGYQRIVTYILKEEDERTDDVGRRIGGGSLRAAGYRRLWDVRGRSWDTPIRPRTDKHPTSDKVAYGWGAWSVVDALPGLSA